MLPHILHTTGRAAAVVHNPTQTIRNVLQLQSSGPSSGSGSSWGNGPGPGGAKYGAGSRFYAGHNSAGRAVTQANAITSHDGQLSQTDEPEEAAPKWTILPTPKKAQRKARMRSSSVSMGVAGRNERAEKLGVLKTVQLHTRGRHAFAAPAESMATAKERLLAEPAPVSQPTQPLLVRRNSTSAPLSPLLNATEPPIPVSDAEKRPPPQETPKKARREEDPTVAAFGRFTQFSDVHEYVQQKLIGVEKPPVRLYNAALAAYIKTRQSGSSLNPIVNLYNDMLSKSVVPNVATYELIIQALSYRDMEIFEAQRVIHARRKLRDQSSESGAQLADADTKQLAELEKEDNFQSAMSLFEGVLASNGNNYLEMGTYGRLILSAANRGDVHSAIHIYAQMEARGRRVPIYMYRHLLLAFSKAGQIEQAEETFKAYVNAGLNNKIHLPDDAVTSRRSHVQVWNMMIESYFRAGMPDKAIELVDQVMKSDAGNHFTCADVPVATSSMFTTVINGFLTTGDLSSALAWFDKLLPLEQGPRDPFQGLDGRPMRPDYSAWFRMMDSLAENGKIDDLNRLFRTLIKFNTENNFNFPESIRLIVYTANVEHLRQNGDNLDRLATIENLKFLVEEIRSNKRPDNLMVEQALEFCHGLASRGEFATSTSAFLDFLMKNKRRATFSATTGETPAGYLMNAQQAANQFVKDVYEAVNAGYGKLPISAAIPLARALDRLGMPPNLALAPAFLNAYGSMVNGDDVLWNITLDDWQLLFAYGVYFEANANQGNPAQLVELPDFAFRGVISLIEHFNSEGHSFEALSEPVRHQVIGHVMANTAPAKLNDVLARLGPQYVQAAANLTDLQYAALENSVVRAATSLNPVESQTLSEPPALVCDPYLTEDISNILGPTTGKLEQHRLDKAYKLFEKHLSLGKVVACSVLCRLIEGEGRVKDLDKVRELYTAAQGLLRATAPEKQLYEWAAIENSMIIGLAHAGHVDAAHVHRVRILEQGLRPSADAYGILVQLVKDTTDDTSGAVALFEESLARGVQPNMYLYNNIISKLAKARKADYAIELFNQMKMSGMRPSSITFGAVIGACARVGDVEAAENLYKEMTRSRNFKPRVPPYNTMMQLFSQTKPNKEAALRYYQEMKKAGVSPSAHTYKLLLDIHGSLEPVNLPEMERTFMQLLADSSVEVTGAHFASLINAYGCVSKDLEKAISVFDSIGTYPRAPKPDAVVYEALINAVVANRRTDLLPVYRDLMTQNGVHMTAYIANFLIKGYANVGDMEKAREIFEGLANPPIGVAAPNNHAPHSPSEGVEVPVMAPVYREPSTWEVMVRAELGAGNRDAAIALLQRLQERQYPEAVYSRISGILTDFSVPQ